jgi:FkbM family methyltransferase
MRLKSAFKDWRRRQQLRRAGIGVELQRPEFAAGARSGVWVVDPTPLNSRSVVYSFGVGDNVAWELAMIERFGCDVHAFDPTPAAVAWVRARTLPPRFRFTPLGIAGFDGVRWFAPPRRARGVDWRPVLGEQEGAVQAPVQRLASIAWRQHHDHVDVLKLDIEGGEYEVLADLLAGGPPVVQLLVEFHHGQHGIPFARTAAAIASLQKAGFRIFNASRRGLEFSFLNEASA